jgi:hypothetical protein
MAEARFNKDRLEGWLARPDTKFFLQFLKDQRSNLMEQWGSGVEMDLRHQAKALLLGEHAALEWRDYAKFYAGHDGSLPDPDETESEAQ